MRYIKGRRWITAALAAAAAALVVLGGTQIADWRQVAKQTKKALVEARLEAWYLAEASLGLDLDHPHGQTAHLDWPVATPASVGLARERLDALRADLAAHATRAFLVVRDGRLAYEWYARHDGPNTRFGVAALAKALVACPLLLAAEADGRIALQDPVAKYLPAWSNDPSKSPITLLNLATHSSGLEDVYFEGEVTGWQQRYVDHPDDRFRMALEVPQVMFTPGSRYAYSGVGYYVLASALTKSLAGTAHPHVRAYYRSRITEPLGIPDTDWELNYGRVSHDGPTELYAIGSGSAFTARAVARIGQLILDHGAANGQSLIAAPYVDEAIRNAGLPPVTGDDGKPAPSIGISWWVNDPKVLPSLPADAAVGAGADHQILLVVPSLRLIVVRLGDGLGSDHWGGRFWTELDERLLAPLMAAVDSPDDGGTLHTAVENQPR
jgi:CubicO group peptidase (beta-lactamase class C family)